ncbi:hypothetical protein JQS43_08210 [Natronosporangium hydrolyticum]|uniref:DUF1648 domain-containing protein n=1 Tax=Natronosporangium hydrolyticum TaxID=2811111 RepID=A0A895YEI3_9ACTN|nr:hypothetical protein [Natronosporangium hydrolyticum]QSB16264.1 hypothetical protein JQS43_08210 [Natronosporangium hydrolyticum]
MARVDEDARRSGPGRWLVGAGLAAAPIGVIGLTMLGWGDRLPDPMPSHWGRAGRVTETVALSSLVTVVTVLGSLGTLLAIGGAVGRRLPHQARRVLVAVGTTVSAFLAGLWVVTAWLSLDLTDPRQAGAPTWHLLVWLVGCGLLGVVAYRVTPSPMWPAATGLPPADALRADTGQLRDGGWRESYRLPRVILAAPLVLLVTAVVLTLATANVWVGLLLVVLAALLTPLCFGRLVLNQTGLRVEFGPWAWPALRVPVAQIARAEPTEVAAAEWGGWGYRMQGGGGRAVITRSGPAVRVTLSQDRYLVVSAAEPELLAGLINSLVEESRGSGAGREGPTP